jgi:hypothetical protein
MDSTGPLIPSKVLSQVNAAKAYCIADSFSTTSDNKAAQDIMRKTEELVLP